MNHPMQRKTLTEFKNERRAKRKKNRSFSTYLLDKHGIPFESRNNGAHLIVGDFDFYPGTGLYKNRFNAEQGRGVFNLIEILEEKQ